MQLNSSTRSGCRRFPRKAALIFRTGRLPPAEAAALFLLHPSKKCQRKINLTEGGNGKGRTTYYYPAPVFFARRGAHSVVSIGARSTFASIGLPCQCRCESLAADRADAPDAILASLGGPSSERVGIGDDSVRRAALRCRAFVSWNRPSAWPPRPPGVRRRPRRSRQPRRRRRRPHLLRRPYRLRLLLHPPVRTAAVRLSNNFW